MTPKVSNFNQFDLKSKFKSSERTATKPWLKPINDSVKESEISQYESENTSHDLESAWNWEVVRQSEAIINYHQKLIEKKNKWLNSASSNNVYFNDHL